MTGAETIVKMLILQEVDTVFGVPGDTSMAFHDAFAKHSKKIRHISCRDERNASYMADGYARTKGKPGVVEVPSGGGALYAVPGISEANESSIPLICLASDITMNSDHTGALTDVAQEQLYSPITKWNTKIKLHSKIPQLIRKAFRMAVGGRPGAVQIAVPENIHTGEIDTKTEKELIGSPFTTKVSSFKNQPTEADIEKAVEILIDAKKPVILAGGGVHLSQAYNELDQLMNEFSIPVATTINGKGSITEFTPYSVGTIGANGGSPEGNEVIRKADLVIVLGSKLNNVTTMGKMIFENNPNIIQVDVGEEFIDDNVLIDLPIMSDIKAFTKEFLIAIEDKKKDLVPSYKKWAKEVEEIMKKKEKRIEESLKIDRNRVNPAKLFNVLQDLTDENSILVADAGTPTPFLSANYKIKKAGRKTILPRSHGSLGYALPAAIGAKAANPDATVFSLFGDGSFGMAVGDLETAKRANLPVVFINFQNNSYGWIKTIQQLYYDENYFAVDFNEIDAVKIAEGFGLEGRRVTKNSELKDAISWAISKNEPVLLDVMIDLPTEVIPPVLKWENDSKVPADKRKKLTY